MVLSQGMRTPAIGIAIGLMLSALLTRVIAHLLYEIDATDPATFAAVALLLAAVAAIACGLAGRRALRLDPVNALRQA
jgi:ABC-type antimicrobial peptide transport system permease subunit